MTVNLAFLTDIASEFAATDSGKVDRLVAIAELQVPAAKWGAQRDLGVAYLVAHMLKVDQLRGSGAASAKSIGDMSVTYISPGTSAGRDADDLELTSYGRSYARLRRMQARGPLVT